MIPIIDFMTSDDVRTALAEREAETALTWTLPWLYLWTPGGPARLREAQA